MDLPWDIICNIAARLPVKSLMRFKAVSKRWDNLTRDPYFSDLQSSNPPSNCFILSRKSGFQDGLYLMDKQNQEWKMTTEIILHPRLQAKPHLQIIATCNGLICFLDRQRQCEEIIIYNPITREIRDIPKLMNNVVGSLTYEGMLYFVHDAKTKKYKLIVLVSGIALLGYIMTIGGDSWRKLEIGLGGIVYQPTITPNGEICWITSERLQIISMNIHDEKFRVIKIPDVIYKGKPYYQQYYLLMYDKNVTLIAPQLAALQEQSFGTKLHVWELVNSEKGTWVRKKVQNKIFSQDVEVVSMVEDDGLLLKLLSRSSYFSKRPSHFVIYNPKSGIVSDILSPHDPETYNLFSFTPSLISLNDFE